MDIALFISGKVGRRVAKVFQQHKAKDGTMGGAKVRYLVFMPEATEAYQKKIKNLIPHKKAFTYTGFLAHVQQRPEQEKADPLFDLGILVGWRILIKDDMFSQSRLGFINAHPGFLPHCRGRRPSFWNFIDNPPHGAPFGVTLHWVDASLDTGPIAYQQEIPKTWLDTNQTLSDKSDKAIAQLFDQHFEDIMQGATPRMPQREKTPLHLLRDIEAATHIALDTPCTPRELLHKLRGRCGEDISGCWFEEEGQRFEVRVSIAPAQETFKP